MKRIKRQTQAQEEVKTTTTKKLVVDILKVLIIGSLVVIAAGLPIENNKYNFVDNINSPEYKAHKSKYKPIIKTRDNQLKDNMANLQKLVESGNITPEYIQDFIDRDAEIKATSSQSLKDYTKTKNDLQASYKFFGWNGFSILD